jgi:membrane-associated phospholipid phosphatase
VLRLTILIRKKSKLLAGGCLFLFAAIAYLTSNHFPSSLPILYRHRGSTGLSPFFRKRDKFPFFFVWATAIALSTLTTKQHYAVDVVAGFGLAVVFYWLFHRRFCYRTTC